MLACACLEGVCFGPVFTRIQENCAGIGMVSRGFKLFQIIFKIILVI